MKKIIYILSALWGMVTVAEAQTAIDMRKQDIVDGVSVENLRMERNGGYIAIDMLWDLSKLDVDDNRAVLLTPWLVNGKDSRHFQRAIQLENTYKEQTDKEPPINKKR